MLLWNGPIVLEMDTPKSLRRWRAPAFTSPRFIASISSLRPQHHHHHHLFLFFFLPRLNASLKIPTSAESGTRFSLSPECLSQSGFFSSSPHRSVSGAGRDIAARESNESPREEQPSSSARKSTTAEAFRSRWASAPPFTTTFSPPRAPVCV